MRYPTGLAEQVDALAVETSVPRDRRMRFPGSALILLSAIGLTGCIIETPPRRPPPPPPIEYGRPPPPPVEYGRPPPPVDYDRRPPPPAYEGPPPRAY
jgi:hypothetical protein